MCGQTTHSRLGTTKNTFRYGVDFVLIDPENRGQPRLFGRNSMNLLSVSDKDHGGEIGNGKGVTWARDVFRAHGLRLDGVQILLLTQPMVFGFGFNPVSFWLAIRAGHLVAVIAEVNNTFGDRHNYFCARADHGPIQKSDVIAAQKVMHVSPFQDVAGRYHFRFSFGPERIAIRIRHDNAGEGVIATLTGNFQKMSNSAILGAVIRRPFWAMRTKALIHWQALILFSKRVQYRSRPNPPVNEVSS